MFTVSGYGVIGFLYQLLFKLSKFRLNINLIFKNIIFFTLPSIAFEVYRILLGQFQGEQYGVKYIYNAEVYNQFVWFFNSIFVKNYSSDLECQNLSEFINCYLFETRFFFSIMMFYTLILLFLMVLFLIKYKFEFFDDFKLIILFTLFSYLFIAFQGLYGFRFIYYSFGFCIILLICYFIFYLENELLAFSIVILYSHYTISRADWFEYNLIFSNIEYFLIALVILLSLFEFIYLSKYKSES